MGVLTDEGRKAETFESRQAAYRTRERLDHFYSGQISLGELEGLERIQLDWARTTAEQFGTAGDLEAAQGILLSLAVLDHRNPGVHAQLGTVTAALGERLEALGFFNRALALAPTNLEALCGRGELLLEFGRLEDGVHDLMVALEIDASGRHWATPRARALLLGVLRAASSRLGQPDGEAGDRP